MMSIVVRAVDSAMKRDIASGDSFDIVIINEKGLRKLDAKEKKGILANS
jgi:20S proteasome alpha/beta subunit